MAISGKQNPSAINQPPIKDVIAILRNRSTWTDLKISFKAMDLSVGSGWAELEGKATDNSDNATKICVHLREYFLQHILAGERYVQLFEMDSSLSNLVIAKLQTAVVQNSEFSKNYPLPISPTNISSAPSSPTLAEIRIFPSGDVALVYCSIRFYEDRMTYQFSQLPSGVQSIYKGIEELITVNKVYFQAYDLVIIRKNLDRLEICIDKPKTGQLNFEKCIPKIYSEVCLNIPELQPVFQLSPLNVFETIKEIFGEPKEGKVKSLSFRTLTGSRKSEKMVRTTDDLRTEKFHFAGMAAVKNEISPYELSVDFEFSFPKGYAELELHARSQELNSQDPQLPGFYIKSTNPSSFSQAVNKVVKYLP